MSAFSTTTCVRWRIMINRGEAVWMWIGAIKVTLLDIFTCNKKWVTVIQHNYLISSAAAEQAAANRAGLLVAAGSAHCVTVFTEKHMFIDILTFVRAAVCSSPQLMWTTFWDLKNLMWHGTARSVRGNINNHSEVTPFFTATGLIYKREVGLQATTALILRCLHCRGNQSVALGFFLFIMASKKIKIWKTKEILHEMFPQQPQSTRPPTTNKPNRFLYAATAGKIRDVWSGRVKTILLALNAMSYRCHLQKAPV